MIWFDTTKTGAEGHRSGLMRVSSRLRQELGSAAQAIAWQDWEKAASANDWFITTELFAEAERPGFTALLRRRPCRTAAVFHDAIPLKFPHTTWPRSVERHPSYLTLLREFDRVWAVSAASRDELLGFWQWQGEGPTPPVEVLPLGADADGRPRVTEPAAPTTPARFLCLGIIEPRKSQEFLLDVCAALWTAGLNFGLDVVGRVNPHFGVETAARLRRMAREYPQLRFHEAATDTEVDALMKAATATIFPTQAEGCGLPLLESLWRGVPVLASDLPPLRENAAAGGCRLVPPNDANLWREAILEWVTNGSARTELARAACSRSMPTWRGAAEILRAATERPR
jgi:glycosyltransferase involved in cell wall biosynthesis